MIACRRDRCGSSVYVQKNWSSTEEDSGEGILADASSPAVGEVDAFAADARR